MAESRDSRARAVVLAASITILHATAIAMADAVVRTDDELVCRPRGHLPRNFSVALLFERLIATMLEKSPTFRHQCVELARAPRLRTVIRLEMMMPLSDKRGETRIVRYETGALRATVGIGPTVDYAVVLAHELEHLLEQVEEADLASMADRPDSGVTRTGSGAFETARAIKAGRSVQREMLWGASR